MKIGDLVSFKNRRNGHPNLGMIISLKYNVNTHKDEVKVLWSSEYTDWNSSWIKLSWIECAK
jgi:hypothetical protein